MALFRTGGGKDVGDYIEDKVINAGSKILGAQDDVYTTTTGSATALTNKFTIGKRYLMIFVGVAQSSFSVSTMTFEGAEDVTPQAYRLIWRCEETNLQSRCYFRVIKATATTIKLTISTNIPKFGVRFIPLDD